MPRTSSLRVWWAQRPPAAGAAVMATGILSVGLLQTGYDVLSGIALAPACAAWLALAADFVLRLVRERERWRAEAVTPGALTAVAATAVLGTRLTAAGRPVPAWALLALAAVLWPRTRYDVRRWATVFPMGMTAVATLSVAAAVGLPWLRGPGEVLLWVAVAAWPAVAAGAVADGRASLRSRAPR